jgi:hypothetical protein
MCPLIFATVAKDKNVRDAFRRHMASHPDQWDYAKVRALLTLAVTSHPKLPKAAFSTARVMAVGSLVMFLAEGEEGYYGSANFSPIRTLQSFGF